ncbi:porin [Flavobacterium sp. '19STA2R22 D10 B1']|uniref:porin n=1 Tax=Flavobacterium aerium TaxID=3037261 RepID=UPI00278C7155|nr:porin [Flavobacterium sp. '19STA2R22 D10 B1']
MKKRRNKISIIIIVLLSHFHLNAQEIPKEEKPKTKVRDLKIKFNEDGSAYLKFGFWNQTWFRYIENNPGTAVNGEPAENTADAGIRRMRLTTTAQFSPRYLMFFQLGFNNQSFISGGGSGTGATGQGKKATLFFHDAYNEYAIIPTVDFDTKKENSFSLYLGGGLHSWNGVSRLTNASSSRLLTADLPVFNFPTIEISDQFSRQMGLFVHGNWDKLGYRLNVNKPFATSLIPTIGGAALDNNKKGKLSFAGYFDYQFFEKEDRKTPFLPGTYLGEKKMLNVGLGFYTNSDGTMTQPTEGVFKTHDITVFGADVFAELPVGNKAKEMSVSVYTVYYNYNFGPNYLRTSGTMNPGTRDETFTGTIAKEGFGNARYLLGTGEIWYTQAGFMLPKFSTKVRIQPFATYALKKLDALAESGHYYDLGTNFLLDGQHAKISLQYSSRPLYDASTNTVFSRAGEFLASLQIFL